MSLFRIGSRGLWRAFAGNRLVSTSVPKFANEREHENAPSWREVQKSKPTGPHLTNTTSTIANEMPSVGADKAPPELISSVDPNFIPRDSIPENTERMTGGTQETPPSEAVISELEVGEIEGAKFKVEPLRRTGEDGNTMRARLLCPFFYMNYLARADHNQLMHFVIFQIRAARGELLKATSFFLPSPMQTSLP